MRQGFSIAKVTRIAAREFAATVLTKGFIIGALVVPGVLMAIIPVIGLLAASAQPPAPTGTLLVLDRSGAVYDTLAQRLSAESIRQRREDELRRVGEKSKEAFGKAGALIAGNADKAAQMVPVPNFRVESLPPDTDIEAAKERIRSQLTAEESPEGIDRVLAVIEIDPDAVVRAGEEFGEWQSFLRPKANSEAVGEVNEAVDWSIREMRFKAAGVDRGQVSALNTVSHRDAQQITEGGEQQDTSGLTSMVVPVVAMLLILVSTFTGGQYLLTTTIEEKSSRVVEVLLSAVSPMELMTGKILGQMCVGLSLLTIYNSLGIVALLAFSISGVLSWQLIVSFFVFFVLAYVMFASMMAAIGSAVNDLREAQSLMTPVMLFSMVPYFFFLPVIRAPNSGLSTALSFVPPISPFIMIMRIATPEPIPAWQIPASIAVNLCGVAFLLWFAAKVFRVGLLMYGKPPNLRTLIKWVRMA